MPRVRYTIPQQGFRPNTNPLGALGAYGRRSRLRGLGDANTFSGCVTAVDAQGNAVACGDPTAAVWFDANMNAVPAGTQAAPSAPSAAGAPTGSYLLYAGTWQIPSSHAFTTPAQILASVLQTLKASGSILGFQVVNASQSGGVLTVSNFNVQIQLFVSGSGFGQPNDAGTFVDHAYNQVTGLMPVVSSTVVTQLPSGTTAAPAPTGTSPFPSGTTGQITSWLESNAVWLAIGLVAITVLPTVVKKVL